MRASQVHRAGSNEQPSGSRVRRSSTSSSTMRALPRIISISWCRQDAWRSHSLDASVAIRSKMSFTNELRMAIALFEIPVSGWTCLRTTWPTQHITRQHQTRLIVAKHVAAPRTLVDVGAVSLLADLLALLLLALSARRRLAWCLLCCLGLRLRRLGGGGGCGSLARGRSGLSRPNQRPISSNPTSTRPHHPTTPLNRIKNSLWVPCSASSGR